MMGLNSTINIIARAQQTDDTVGGSVRADATRYAGVRARISQPRPAQLLMQQGFEVVDTYEVIIYPDRYPAIQSEDIVTPLDGQFAGARLRVQTVEHSSLPPSHPRSHMQLFCKRVLYAENNVPE
jgi:hypothetical protein